MSTWQWMVVMLGPVVAAALRAATYGARQKRKPQREWRMTYPHGNHGPGAWERR